MNIQEGKEDKTLTFGRQIYMHWKNELMPWVCGETWKQWNCNCRTKANLRAIHMATKSRPMKSLRNF